MKELHKEIFKVFESLGEAVVAAKKEQIVYANPAAVKLFGNGIICGIPTAFFNELLLDENCGDVTGTVTLNGEWLPATALNMDGFRVITVRSNGGPCEKPAADYMVASAGLSMKNSLAVCLMSLGLLRGKVEQIDDQKLIQYVAALDKACHGIARIVSNYTKLCDLDSENTVLHESAFDIVELCDDLVVTLDYLMHDRDINISWESERDSIIYYGDGDKIERMLLNLMSNSIKYTPAGGKIKLIVRTTTNGVMLQVKDNGRGIQPETLSTVFSRYKSPRDITDDKAGAGLGMPVVQQIANLHGGSVVIESKVDIGTTVTVQLPFRKIPDDAFMESKAEYKNDMSVFLTELSDVLTYRDYCSEHHDE